MELGIIKRGSTGDLVAMWQEFLLGEGYYQGQLHATFDAATERATKSLEHTLKYEEDGIVDSQLWGHAFKRGYALLTTPYEMPQIPDFHALNVEQKNNLFGRIVAKPAPTLSNPEGLTIVNNWQAENLTTLVIPQLAANGGKVSVNKKMAAPMTALFAAWEDHGLISYIRSWGGCWCPRYVRRAPGVLSSHAWGTAFDINAKWNGLGRVPAPEGKIGSVIRLVEDANRFGFWWGGHWTRPDGMHFELAKEVL